MYTTPLSDAIKRAVGARMPQPSSDPFIALTVDVPELAHIRARTRRSRSICQIA
jgi:hypothetical protein